MPFCKFHLGDRPIPVTFKRAIAALSLWQKARLAWGLCFLSDPIRYDFILVHFCVSRHFFYICIVNPLLFENRNMLHVILKFAIPILRVIYLLLLFVPSSTAVLDGVWSFSKEDVEKCKQKDLLEQTMSEMIGEFPALHQTIVAERDIYLTHTLRQATRCVEAPHNSQSNYFS